MELRSHDKSGQEHAPSPARFASLTRDDWNVWEEWFTFPNAVKRARQYRAVFDKIGYISAQSPELYRGVMIPLEQAAKAVSGGITMSPRQIASWSYKWDVASGFASEFTKGMATGCAGVVIHRKIPAKHIVWDSTDKSLVKYAIQNHRWMDQIVKGALSTEDEVVVAGLSSYRLTRRHIHSIRLEPFRRAEIQRWFDIPDHHFNLSRRAMVNSLLILHGKDLKNIRVIG